MKCPICDSLITNEETCLVCQYPHLNKFFVEPVEEIKKYHDDYKRQWKETLNSQAINAITNLQSHIQGNALLLTWDWPNDIEKVVVSLRYDDYPSSVNDPLAKIFADMSIAEYNRNGCWRLPLHIEKKIHYFSVYAQSTEGGVSLPTRIKERAMQFHELSYQVIKAKRFFLFQTTSIKMRVKGSSSYLLKNLSLIGNSDHLPTSINDGVVLMKIASLDLNSNGIADIFVSKQYWNESYFVRLFFQQSEDAEEMHLIHSSLENMRLG